MLIVTGLFGMAGCANAVPTSKPVETRATAVARRTSRRLGFRLTCMVLLLRGRRARMGGRVLGNVLVRNIHAGGQVRRVLPPRAVPAGGEAERGVLRRGSVAVVTGV